MKDYFMLLKHNLILTSKIADLLWAMDSESFSDEIRERGLIIGTCLTAIQMIISIVVIAIMITVSLFAYQISWLIMTIRKLIGKPFTYNDIININEQTDNCIKYIDDELNKYYK